VQLGRGADERQLRRADEVAVAGREAGAQRVVDRAGLERLRPVHAHLAGEHDLAQVAAGDALDRAFDRGLEVLGGSGGGDSRLVRRVRVEQRHRGG
jgi:hypothetical protein